MGSEKKRPSGPGSRTLLVALLLIVVFVVAASRLQACDAASGFCAGKCAVRCGRWAGGKGKGKGKGKAACMQRCGLCCEECACVPTGKTGSRDECPCYRDMLTTGPKKRPKCP